MPEPVVISTISAFIAVIAAIIGARNLHLAMKKFDMDSFKWQRDYFADLIKWADSCIDALSDAVHLCDVDPARSNDFFSKRIDLLAKLSSLIDRGRLFFPNYEADHGKEEPSAFQGYRHEVLDTLVAAYRLVDQFSYTQQSNNRAMRDQLVESKRQFTAYIQDIVAPRSRQAEYEKIIAPKIRRKQGA